MLSDEIIEKVTERLVRRIEQGNEYVLEQIGKSIKRLSTLTPSKAQELVQIMKYGGDYDKITKRLAQITKLNVQDIKKIFEEVAKHDYQFAKQFYEYRNKKYIPYEKNITLQRQVDALANLTAKKYVNMTKTLAFATRNSKGKVVYTPLSKMYQQVLDEAVLNVGQGKENFYNAMHRTLKQLGESGIRSVDYESGRSMRIDSAVRMNMNDGLRTLHNELQDNFGKEFDADGVEITVHSNPAPDHKNVQGRQFSTIKPSKNELSEWEKLQSGKDAKDYKGNTYNLDHDDKNGYRPISTMNCYHYTFAIVLGISEPEYTDKQLQEINNKNDKGFELDGKHYTMYEGTQLQRKLETEIRKQKDAQILSVASGDNEGIIEAQAKIRQLTTKYKELSKASGLPTKMKRMQVSGYKRVATK